MPIAPACLTQIKLKEKKPTQKKENRTNKTHTHTQRQARAHTFYVMKHKILTSFVYLVECKYWNALKYIQFIDISSSLFFARIKFTFHCHLQLHWEILVRRTFFSLSLSWNSTCSTHWRTKSFGRRVTILIERIIKFHAFISTGFIHIQRIVCVWIALMALDICCCLFWNEIWLPSIYSYINEQNLKMRIRFENIMLRFESENLMRFWICDILSMTLIDSEYGK